MGAAENIELIRGGYKAFNAGDLTTLKDLFADSVSWHTPGRGPLAGDHEGRDATFEYFGKLGQQTAGTFRAELENLAADDNGHVVGVHHNTADRNGQHLDVHCCLVFEIRDGQVVGCREHFDDLYAWDDFWS